MGESCTFDVDTPAGREENKPVSYYNLFRFATNTDKCFALVGMLCSVLSGIFYTFPFYVTGNLASCLIMRDERATCFGKHEPRTELCACAMPFIVMDVVFATTMFVVCFVQHYLLSRVSHRISANLRVAFMGSLLRQDATSLSREKFGALNAQLSQNIDTIREGIGANIGIVVRSLGVFIGWTGYSLTVDFRCYFMLLPAFPVGVLLMILMTKLVTRASRKQDPIVEKASSILQESIINVKTLQCFNAEEENVEYFRQTLAEGRYHSRFIYFWNGFFDGSIFLVIYTFLGAGLYFSGLNFFEGKTTRAGDVFIVPGGFFMAAFYISMASPCLVSITRARVAAGNLYAHIDRANASRNEKGVVVVFDHGKIEFQNVRFGYNHKNPILNGLTFTALPGSTTALVGPSGAGKSTTLMLIMRMYSIETGTILIDGLSVDDLNVASLRRQIGIVQQEPVLFSGTIAENIRLGDDRITDEQIVKACKIANASEFIDALPDVYDTVIGRGGIQLLGGQKQRIAIARAIAPDPRILLLDEATSALDVLSEVAVQKALKAAAAGRTTIVIAHRLSTLRDADLIVVVENGVVVEEGTHEALKKKGCVYAKLVKAQEFQDDSTPLMDSETQNATDDIISDPGNDNQPVVNEVNVSISQDSLGGRQRHGLVTLYRNLDGNYILICCAMFLAVLRGMELPLFGINIYNAYDDIQIGGSRDRFNKAMIILFGACAALGVYVFITLTGATTLFGVITENVIDSIKIRAMASALNRPARYFDRPNHSNAQVLARINRDTPGVRPALDTHVMTFFNFGMSTVMSAGLAAFFCWPIVCSGTVFIAGILGIMYCLAMAATPTEPEGHQSAHLTVEMIENVKTIQLLTREEFFMTKYVTNIQMGLVDSLSGIKYEAAIYGTTFAIAFLSDAISFIVAIPLVYNGFFASRSAFVAAFNVCMAAISIQFVGVTAIDILKAKPAAESVFALIDDPATVELSDATTSKTEQNVKIEGLVEFKHVTFAYPNRPKATIMNRLSFLAKPGQSVALVGPSGSGKSTVIQLILRHYVHQSGDVKIDGISIDSFDVHNLRSQVALVGQEPVLFSGSVVHNVLLGMTDKADRDAVIEACKMANAHEFIELLPNGYETDVGEKGLRLSGGQKQRIAIARAVVRKPAVLLLDEATSALDSENERIVQAALDEASNSRTCISIAHRLTTVQHADVIYFIDGGRVAEFGTHEHLMRQDGRYADLVRRQDLKNTNTHRSKRGH